MSDPHTDLQSTGVTRTNNRRRAMLVSITGIRLHSPIPYFRFYWHAIRCRGQAVELEGNLETEVCSAAGVQHTFKVWENEAAVRLLVHSGTRAKAVEAFHTIGSGHIHSYDANRVPNRDEAYGL